MNLELIKNWFKKRENLALFGIILLAFLIRIYYFILTKDQPLWFDEAEYMNIGKSWVGLYSWDFNPLRPVLFSFIFCLFLKIGLGELTMKFFVIITSLISIFFLYKLGELFFNKLTGIFAAFFLSLFWSFSFYSYRLLVDVPLTCLWVLTIYFFFYAYLNNKNWKHYILPGIFLGLSFLMKGSSVILVLLIAIYLLLTEKSKSFSSTKNYIFYGTSFLTILPYLIWEKIKFGSFIAFYTYGRGGMTTLEHTFLESLYNQIIFSFRMLDASLVNSQLFYFPFTLLLTLGGICLVVYSFLLYEKIFIKNSSQNKNFFLVLWLVLGLLFFGWNNYGAYMDERYYFVFYPVLFLFAGYALNYIYNKTKTKTKIAGILILILLSLFAYQQIYHTNQTVEIKLDSFNQLKDAGLFVKENTLSSENFVVNEEMAELVYYAERNTNREGTISNLTHLNLILTKNKPSYLVFSNFYYLSSNSKEHIDVLNFVFMNRTLFTPVKVFGPAIAKDGKIPLVTVFKINY